MRYNLSELISPEELRNHCEEFSVVTRLAAGVADNATHHVLAYVGWKDVCKNLHSAEQETACACKAGNAHITSSLQKAGEIRLFQCSCGLVDALSPIYISNKHVGTVCVGQVFLSQPDLGVIRKLVADAGGDLEASMALIAQIPVMDEGRFRRAVLHLVRVISQMVQSVLVQRKMKEEADTAMKQKFSLISTISHDFRTALNSIHGMGHMLLSTALTPDQQEFAEAMDSGSESMVDLVNDLFEYALLESGNTTVARLSFDLQYCVEHALDTIRYRAEEKNVTLAWGSLAPLSRYWIGDEEKLYRVLVSVLTNGLKYTENGSIDVRIATAAEQNGLTTLTFAVHDTGIPIANDIESAGGYAAYLDSGSVRRYEGTGLSVAIASKLVQVMGGKIWMDETVTEGATICFTLTTTPTNKPPKVQESVVLPKLAGVSALLVAENEAARENLIRILEQWKFAVRSTEKGRDAQNWLLNNDHFDIAIIEYSSSGKQVEEITRMFHHFRAPKQMPVVVITTSQEPLFAGQQVFEFPVLDLAAPPETDLLDLVALALREARPDLLQPSAKSTADQRLMGGDDKSLSILVAEDQPGSQKLMGIYFQKLGYNADIARNGVEVLRALESKYYDIIFMDIQMPIMNGIDAAIAISKRYAKEERPIIIALTANVMPGDVERCMKAGMDDYVGKPIVMKDLQSAIAKWEDTIKAKQKAARMPKFTPLLVDLKTLQQTRELDRWSEVSILDKLISAFEQETPGFLETFEKAYRAKNLPEMTHTGKTLRGICVNLGLRNFAAIADELNRRIALYDLSDIPTFIDLLQESYLRTTKELFKYVNAKQ